MLLLLLLGASPLAAQSGRHVRVTLTLEQSGAVSQDAIGASGRVVITDRGSVRGDGRAGAVSRQTRTRQSTGIFTIVQDGGESTLVVASQLPYPQVAWFHDYATGAGHLATGIAFKDVGTSLRVGATVLPGNRVRVRLTPTISWLAADRSGTIEFTEAATELVVPSGRPVVLGGTTTQTHEVTRRILGYRAGQAQRERLMTLTATVQP
jgi:hypothetical protein